MGFDFSFTARPVKELNETIRCHGGKSEVVAPFHPLPFQPGMFKCTDKRYQIELMMIRNCASSFWAFPDPSNPLKFIETDVRGRFLEGVKLTGNPTVPCGNVSFVVDLDEPIFPMIEQQERLMELTRVKCSEAAMAEAENEDGLEAMRQPFVLPRYTDVDVEDFAFPQFCGGRFLAQVQELVPQCSSGPCAYVCFACIFGSKPFHQVFTSPRLH